jgi:hypothetical protein
MVPRYGGPAVALAEGGHPRRELTKPLWVFRNLTLLWAPAVIGPTFVIARTTPAVHNRDVVGSRSEASRT